MIRASCYFNENDRERLREAVKEAEKGTSGEIVPVVASASGDYDRAEDCAGFIFSLLVLSLVWLNYQGIAPSEGWNANSPVLKLGLPSVLLILVAGFITGTFIASRFWFLRNLFTPRSLMLRSVEEAAQRAFVKNRLRATEGATGILIYVSLFERMVKVMGDRAISDKLDEKTWEEVVEIILKGFREKKAVEGLEAGIRKCGEILATHFPRKADDVDELPNDVVFID